MERQNMAYDIEKEISVTEALNDCGRIWQYHYEIQEGLLDFKIHTSRNGMIESRTPGIHMYQARGSIAHLALDRYVNGLETEWTWKDFIDYDSIGPEKTFEGLEPDMFEFVKPYSMKCFRNGVDFIDSSNLIDFNSVETEKRMLFKISDECTLSGKPDITSPSVLLDWKTGKESFLTQSKYKMQLAGYNFLETMVSGYTPEKHITVYLGGGSANSVGVSSEDISISFDKFMARLENAITVKNDAYSGKHMPCKTSFLCTMCEFAGLCRGV
jgi:hypothetical protein